MVTIKDIANACSVSQSTVSKALNGYGDVNPDTARLIQETAKKMGYLPNLAARSLKTNRTYSIGILFTDQMQSGLKHEYFSGILNSFKEQAEEQGYNISFISKNPGGQKMSCLEQCRYRNYDGVMIACTDYEDPDVLELVKGELPVITIDYAFDSCSAVISNNVQGMQELVEYVCGRGHRKIAYIHGEPTSVTKKRLASFYRTCAAYGIEPPAKWIVQARYRDADLCGEITAELLRKEERPECIFYPDDFALVGGLNVIKDMGLRIPEDISIAGYDGSFLAELLSPKLTTYRQDTDRIGRIAATKLIEAIEKPQTWLAEQIFVAGQLVPGESVSDVRE